jgi:hypothetical protein
VSENPYGFTLQGGVFVSDDVELVARYEDGDADTNAATNDFSTLTFGANWYMAQNTAKLGFNFGYAFDWVESLGRRCFGQLACRRRWRRRPVAPPSPDVVQLLISVRPRIQTLAC